MTMKTSQTLKENKTMATMTLMMMKRVTMMMCKSPLMSTSHNLHLLGLILASMLKEVHLGQHHKVLAKRAK